jgi:hypothetical protein
MAAGLTPPGTSTTGGRPFNVGSFFSMVKPLLAVFIVIFKNYRVELRLSYSHNL